MSAGDVRVHGTATAEEVAAVLAALRVRGGRHGGSHTGPYGREERFEQWRRQRLAVLRENG